MLLLSVTIIEASTKTPRTVKENVLISEALPPIQIQIDPAFVFVGSFPFLIDQMATGERFVFVEGDGKRMKRIFIAQFESILPESPEIYRYNFDKATEMGGRRFRHNTFAFSVQEARNEAPGKEADLTAQFLEQKGFVGPDIWMASRFLTLGDATRKHELILFYMEPVDTEKHSLADFYIGQEETQIWKDISAGLKTRSLNAFKIAEHP